MMQILPLLVVTQLLLYLTVIVLLLVLLLFVTMVIVIESAKSVTLLLKNCSKNRLVRLNLINLLLLKSNGVLGIIVSSSGYDYCYLSICY